MTGIVPLNNVVQLIYACGIIVSAYLVDIQCDVKFTDNAVVMYAFIMYMYNFVFLFFLLLLL